MIIVMYIEYKIHQLTFSFRQLSAPLIDLLNNLTHLTQKKRNFDVKEEKKENGTTDISVPIFLFFFLYISVLFFPFIKYMCSCVR